MFFTPTTMPSLSSQPDFMMYRSSSYGHFTSVVSLHDYFLVSTPAQEQSLLGSTPAHDYSHAYFLVSTPTPPQDYLVFVCLLRKFSVMHAVTPFPRLRPLVKVDSSFLSFNNEHS